MSELPLPPGVRGPFFVSIGDPAKLEKFLEINSAFLSPDQVFVDGYDRAVYGTVGFGTFADPVDPNKAREAAKKLRAPDLGGLKGWLAYLGSAAELAPIPPSAVPVAAAAQDGRKGLSSLLPALPEGVLQLGGTLVVRGNEILYLHADAVPGDTPDVDEVLRVLQEAASANAAQDQ